MPNGHILRPKTHYKAPIVGCFDLNNQQSRLIAVIPNKSGSPLDSCRVILVAVI